MALTGKRVNGLGDVQERIANVTTVGTRERKKIKKFQDGQMGVLMNWRFEKWRMFDKLVTRVPT